MAKRILILLVLAGVLVGPGDLSSCGPFLPEAVFTSKTAPLDEARFFDGELGVLQPSYYRVYLMVAYRYLSGIGLSAADQEDLLTSPPDQGYAWLYGTSPALKEWLQARAQVPGVTPIAHMDRFKAGSQYAHFLNCNDDAFRNAAETLRERARAGANSEAVKNWLAAQDQVFANCSTPRPWERPAKPPEPSIPAPLPASADRAMRADRDYQIAAAKFYAGQFDEAEADFERIAEDRSSPWHNVAPYLAARALIRKATLVDAGAAAAAHEQLRKVLANPDAGPWHESTRGLMQYLRAQTEPEQVLNELAHTVTTEKSGIAGPTDDYRYMLDRYLDHGKDVSRDEEITDWIVTMQRGFGQHAIERWQATHSLPWLVAALTSSTQPDPELIAEASRVTASAPAYLTVAFHSLRLMPAGEARAKLDAILRSHVSASDRNLFLAARMRLARNWDELLRYAPRTVVASDVDGPAQEPATGPAKRYFDQDAARVLDRQATLPVLRDAALSPHLARDLQSRMALAVWVRSVMLNDTAMGKQIAPVLSARAPYLKSQLEAYLAAPDEKARAFATAWLMMKNPGVRPSVEPGDGRLTPIPKLDSLRDNWWCPSGPWFRDKNPQLNAPLALLYQRSLPEARFVSTSERAAAKDEQERLRSAPSATTFMARQAVEWAEAHPNDPRAAESLHLAIRAAHYACGGDGQTDRWVERAFRLLHRRYLKTEWARKTRYWYKVDRP